jgi:hypothetical protein
MTIQAKLSTLMTKREADFDTWKRLVDRACVNRCGMDTEMLPDWDFRTAYDNGMSAVDAARRVITNAKNY